MSLFIPPSQLRNMLDNEIGQALIGRADLGRLVALSAATQQADHHHHSNPYVEDNWMDDDDDNFWV